ncbi:hypothetical protein Hanom_Chr05g00447871 [Helianthus anomalus]
MLSISSDCRAKTVSGGLITMVVEHRNIEKERVEESELEKCVTTFFQIKDCNCNY